MRGIRPHREPGRRGPTLVVARQELDEARVDHANVERVVRHGRDLDAVVVLFDGVVTVSHAVELLERLLPPARLVLTDVQIVRRDVWLDIDTVRLQLRDQVQVLLLDVGVAELGRETEHDEVRRRALGKQRMLDGTHGVGRGNITLVNVVTDDDQLGRQLRFVGMPEAVEIHENEAARIQCADEVVVGRQQLFHAACAEVVARISDGWVRRFNLGANMMATTRPRIRPGVQHGRYGGAELRAIVVSQLRDLSHVRKLFSGGRALQAVARHRTIDYAERKGCARHTRATARTPPAKYPTNPRDHLRQCLAPFRRPRQPFGVSSSRFQVEPVPPARLAASCHWLFSHQSVT